MKEYTSLVSIAFAGNNIEADSKEDYIEKLKDSFMEEFGLDIEDEEITEIEEVKWRLIGK